jgi:hypothetical protein
MIELILPVEDQNKIIVSNNEFINNSTINRGHLRLLINDKQLRDWIAYLSGEVDNLESLINFGGGTGGSVNVYGLYNQDSIVTFYADGNGPSGWIRDSGYTINDLLYQSTFRVQVVHTVGSPYTITPSDNYKIFVDESASSFTYNLPAVSAGLCYTFVKNTAATLSIKAFVGEKIADSSIGGYFTDSTSTENYATVTLLGIKTGSTSKWVVEGAHGTWITS